MVDAMKINERAADSLLSPKRVVQLPEEPGLDLEHLACAAFLSVAAAWKVLILAFVLCYTVLCCIVLHCIDALNCLLCGDVRHVPATN
jgi:hypothetical protein